MRQASAGVALSCPAATALTTSSNVSELAYNAQLQFLMNVCRGGIARAAADSPPRCTLSLHAQVVRPPSTSPCVRTALSSTSPPTPQTTASVLASLCATTACRYGTPFGHIVSAAAAVSAGNMVLTIAACAAVQLFLLQDNVRVVYYDDIAMDSVTDETSCLHGCTTCCCGTEGEYMFQLPAN
jgi:hypothetical protein